MSKLITGSSLIIGVLLIGIFNFLVPGNSDAFTENVTEINAFTENLGSNKENAQIFFIIIGLGLIFFLNGILGIYKGIGDREKNIKSLAITLNIVAIVMFLITLGIANAFADSAEMNMIAYQIANQAGTNDPAKVLKVMRKGKFDTVIGSLSFDKKGDVSLPGYVFYEWSKGKYKEL